MGCYLPKPLLRNLAEGAKKLKEYQLHLVGAAVFAFLKKDKEEQKELIREYQEYECELFRELIRK